VTDAVGNADLPARLSSIALVVVVDQRATIHDWLEEAARRRVQIAHQLRELREEKLSRCLQPRCVIGGP
jgi:hypothetical protein